jgi:hypothetical protein
LFIFSLCLALQFQILEIRWPNRYRRNFHGRSPRWLVDFFWKSIVVCLIQQSTKVKTVGHVAQFQGWDLSNGPRFSKVTVTVSAQTSDNSSPKISTFYSHF